MNPLLIGYDGSEDAQQAIAGAAGLFPGASAVVLTAWRPLVQTLAHYPMAAAAPLPTDIPKLDEDFRLGAERTPLRARSGRAQQGFRQRRRRSKRMARCGRRSWMLPTTATLRRSS